MGAEDTIITIVVTAIIGLVGIYVLASFPAVEGPLAGTAQQVRIDITKALALGAGGVVTVTILIVGLLQGI
jgi:hypothetical protein